MCTISHMFKMFSIVCQFFKSSLQWLLDSYKVRGLMQRIWYALSPTGQIFQKSRTSIIRARFSKQLSTLGTRFMKIWPLISVPKWELRYFEKSGLNCECCTFENFALSSWKSGAHFLLWFYDRSICQMCTFYICLTIVQLPVSEFVNRQNNSGIRLNYLFSDGIHWRETAVKKRFLPSSPYFTRSVRQNILT